jgi:uncharacterized phage-associated protein
MADNGAPDRQNEPDVSAFLAPLVGFRSRKAAQLCAYFAGREADGMIDKLKLIKLIYLAERRCLADWHRPMLFDEMFSLPHGPVCSSTLNGIDGAFQKTTWDEYISRHGNRVVAVKRLSRSDLDEVSDAEFSIVERIWRRFGGKTASQLRNYTHDKCPEYTETSGRIPISYKEILTEVGASVEEAEAIERDIANLRREESALTG